MLNLIALNRTVLNCMKWNCFELFEMELFFLYSTVCKQNLNVYYNELFEIELFWYSTVCKQKIYLY